MRILATKVQNVTTTLVLKKIEEMSRKQQFKKAQISVDTLSLIFNLNPAEILMIVEELEQTGKLERHLPGTLSKQKVNLGSVSLL